MSEFTLISYLIPTGKSHHSKSTRIEDCIESLDSQVLSVQRQALFKNSQHSKVRWCKPIILTTSELEAGGS
jgi:hypothetical protein